MPHENSVPSTRPTPLRALLCALAISLCLASAASAQQAVFGTATLQDYAVPEGAFWTIRDPNFPYPRELAEDGVNGCLIAEVTVTKSGKSKDIEVIRSFPDQGLDRVFKRSLNRIRWVPMTDGGEKREEVRQVRIDFCASYASQEDARRICAYSGQQPCE